MKSVAEDLWSELKNNGIIYLYIFFFFTGIIFIIYYKFKSFNTSSLADIFYLYSVLTLITLLLKYVACLFHPLDRWSKIRPRKWPAIDVIIPGFNEGSAVYETVRSINNSNYPKDRLNIVLINDGSTDDTLAYMKKAQEKYKKRNIVVINFRKNKGKKEAMAAGFRKTKSEYVIFVDSDSKLKKDCLKELVRPFYSKNPRIRAVSGHALVWNSDVNLLTKMQEIRYFNAFRSAKAAESLFGFVSCCPGCCSAYERTAMKKILKPWLDQSFLGAKCTYGDDRSLTNFILKEGYQTVYNQKAVAYTIAPHTFKKFAKQQLRWKKSWARESVVVMSFVWKRHPLVSLMIGIDIITPFFAPIVILQIFLYHSFVNTPSFYAYLIGILVFASTFGLFYKIHNSQSKKWLQASIVSSLVSIVLFWQLPYALMTLKDTKWGTR